MNMKKMTIVDLSRAFAGTERAVMDALLDLPGTRDGDLVVVCGHGQHRILESHGYSASYAVVEDPRNVEAVVNRVWALMTSTEAKAAKQVDVLSFHAQVRNLGASLPADDIRRFSFDKPPTPGGAAEATEVGSDWPARWVSIEEAVEALERGLRRQRALTPSSAVGKTALRYLLVAEDARFDKSKSPAARTPRLISMIVEAAAQRHVVELGPPGVDQPVWLSTVAPAGSGPEGAAGPVDAEVADGQPAATTTAEFGDPSLVAEAAPSTSDARYVPKTRSQVFVNILRSNGVGVFPRVRHLVYYHLEDQIKNGTRVSRRALVREAVNRVRAERPELDPFPWRLLRVQVETFLARAAVALDQEGQALDGSWGALSTEVHSFADGWREALDGELVLELLRIGGDRHVAGDAHRLDRVDKLATTDIPDLAGGLLADRSEKAVDFMTRVLVALIQVGKVEVDKEGDLVLAT